MSRGSCAAARASVGVLIWAASTYSVFTTLVAFITSRRGDLPAMMRDGIDSSMTTSDHPPVAGSLPPLRVVGDEPASELELSGQFFLIIADRDQGFFFRRRPDDRGRTVEKRRTPCPRPTSSARFVCGLTGLDRDAHAAENLPPGAPAICVSSFVGPWPDSRPTNSLGAISGVIALRWQILALAAGPCNHCVVEPVFRATPATRSRGSLRLSGPGPLGHASSTCPRSGDYYLRGLRRRIRSKPCLMAAKRLSILARTRRHRCKITPSHFNSFVDKFANIERVDPLGYSFT